MSIYKRLLQGENVADLLVSEIYNNLPDPEFMSDEQADEWMEENVNKEVRAQLKKLAQLIEDKQELASKLRYKFHQ
jgi:hypothetical protein